MGTKWKNDKVGTKKPEQKLGTRIVGFKKKERFKKTCVLRKKNWGVFSKESGSEIRRAERHCGRGLR